MFLGTTPPHFLSTSRNGDSTTSLGSLCQCTTTLREKFFLTSKLNLPCHNLRPFPLILSTYDFFIFFFLLCLVFSDNNFYSFFCVSFQDVRRFPADHSLPWGPAFRAMVVCHSLIVLEGKIQGDPLDVKMFEATNWVNCDLLCK